MKSPLIATYCVLLSICVVFCQTRSATGQGDSALGSQTLEEVKAAGALGSSYRKQVARSKTTEVPKADLQAFRENIKPLLREACVQCHGPKKQKSDFRVDTLNPDLIKGKDADWWLEVMDVVSNGEMPPEDEDVQLSDEGKGKIIDWLSNEIQVASQVARSEQGHTSFRRMTRYEYSYALQDLLGLPYDFARDLPPETVSEDGFKNSSEMLQMSVMQFEQYRELSRKALRKAIVSGEQPEPIYYGISMRSAAARLKARHAADLEKKKKQHKDNPKELEKVLKQAARHTANPGNTHYKNLHTGEGVRTAWGYHGAKYAWTPSRTKPEIPKISTDVVIIPSNQKYIIDLGDGLPDTGNMRVRIRASQTSQAEKNPPNLQLFIGNQASNDSQVTERLGDRDVAIKASPDKPQFYQWDVPLGEVVRNAYRHTQKLGDLPNPAEYLLIRNSSGSKVDIQIDYVEIIAPANEQWPPDSHSSIFIESQNKANETKYAREVLTRFMGRAWRRPVTDAEIEQKLALFSKLRPSCDDSQEAMVEVLATVISSPKFLYLVRSNQADDKKDKHDISDFELATRLSMFLWCSIPDQELLDLAAKGKLRDPEVMISETKRLLADPRAERFGKHYVRQWLGMQLLDFLAVDKKAYRQFDPSLKEAMQNEPVAFFNEILKKNHSVMDFIHADYAMVNERLAKHYQIPEVYGNHFRRVPLNPEGNRGGLLTQAGLLAMNSDGKDSNPLKRGIWLLESILNDPPPPPPPAVPEIDLADPEILKLTLKERMEDHRSKPACISCHAKIDPWGIAFENFDAIGAWREKIGNTSVDSSSVLFNKQELHGADGLKRFLLQNRQDQFARAMTHKMASYALGRPLTFGDRAQIDRITAELRSKGDGLSDLILLIVTSDLFQTK